MTPIAPATEDVAVLTGDLIKSTQLSPEQMAVGRDMLNSAFEDFCRLHDGACQGVLSFYRGDGWQMVLTRPELALRAAVWMRGRLIASGAADTRIAIGVGAVDHLSDLPELGAGEAFTLSGRTIDAMNRRSARIVATLAERYDGRTAWVKAVATGLSILMDGWTQRQAEIAMSAMATPDASHTQIAQAFAPPVTQQAVSDSLAAAGWPAFINGFDAFESEFTAYNK